MTKLLVVIVATLDLAGCNTIPGAGKGIEAGGKAVDGAAQDKWKM